MTNIKTYEIETIFPQYRVRQGRAERISKIPQLREIIVPDFEALCDELHIDSIDDIEFVNEILENQVARHYFVEDHIGERRTRIGQQVFSHTVKQHYGWTCAITGVTTKEFLIGSHIVAWADDKTIRLDPSNGICLSVLVDKAFDTGFISIADDYRILLSSKVEWDAELYNLLKPYQNRRINLPDVQAPNKSYLKRHRQKYHFY